MNTAVKKEEDCSQDKFSIAKIVLIFSFAVIGVLGTSAIIFSDGKDIKDILSLLLPVVGTWVGTVIAFYFSRENFKSATKSSEALIKKLTFNEKLESVTAQEAMTKIKDISYYDIKKENSEILLKTDIIDQYMEKNDRKRLPFFKDKKIKYMLHRSIIDQYLVNISTESDKNLIEYTLADFIGDSKNQIIATQSFETVLSDVKLSKVKQVMDNNKSCSDVFVTQDGTVDSEVLGWITNAKIMSHANV